MKPLASYGLLALGAFLVGGLVCRGDRSGEAAQRTADSLAVIVDSLEARDGARAMADQAADDTIARLRAANRQLGQRVASTAAYGDSLTRALRVWADSMVPKRLVLAFIDSTQATIQLQARQIAGLERASGIADRQRQSADSAAAAWRQVALRLQGHLTAALRRSKWGCYGGAGASLGYGSIGDRAGVGTVAGVGITCGKRL